MAIRSTLCVTAAFVALALSGPTPSHARQSPGSTIPATVEAFNAAVPVSGTKDLTPELFPALIAMSAPPSDMTLHAVSLMTSESEQWSAWESWAAQEPQQNVIKALKKVTDPKGKWAFNLRYGASATEATWVKEGLYVELGSPELIAGANQGLRYLERFDRLLLLCSVEAERLAVLSKPKELVEVMVAWIRFARSVADRPFAGEKAWAYRAMIAGLERLRDVVCLHPELLGVEQAKLAVDELDLRAILPERIKFPTGERAGLMQLMNLTMEERGGVKAGTFASTMAGLSSQGRAVNRFAQAGYWAGVEGQHAGWFDTRDQINKIFGDWNKRWDLNDMFDPYMDQPEDWSRVDMAKFAMVYEVLKDVDLLFDLRAVLQVELAGTRTAMGVVGYRAGMKAWPPNLPAVQPRFVQRLDFDPWFYEPEREQRLDFRYFVPIRDEEFGERAEKKPRTVRVNTGPGLQQQTAPAQAPGAGQQPAPASGGDGLGLSGDDDPPPAGTPAPAATNPVPSGPRLYTGPAVRRGQPFEVGIDQTEFILYSVGPDGNADFADAVGYGGNDVLIWPPILNLERRAVRDGQIESGAEFNPLESFSLRNAGFGQLSPIASQVYNASTGAIDMPKLRELWAKAMQEHTRKEYASEMKLQAINTAMQMTASMDVAMLIQATRQMLEMSDAAAIVERDAKEFGLTPDEVKELVVKVNEEGLKSPSSVEIREKVKGGATLTADDMVKLVPETIEVLTQPAFEPYLKKILAHLTSGK